MIRQLLTLLAVGLLVTTGVSPLSAESITWYQPDLPPYAIHDGPQKELGIDNRIIRTMVDHLPGYTHSYKKANYTRILQHIEYGEPGIATPLFRTPAREKFVHYTKIPSYLVLPNGFIYRKVDRNKFDTFILEDGTLDLNALCRSGIFRIGINSGRSYHGVLDELIHKYEMDKVFYVRSGIDHLGILKMVADKRIDAALGFPVEIKYFGFSQDLAFLHVSKMNPYTPVFFGGPKNEFGFRIIGKINDILTEKQILDQFAKYYMYWLDEEKKEEYEQLRRSYYQKVNPEK